MAPGDVPLPPVGMNPMIPGSFYLLTLPTKFPRHPISWGRCASFPKDPPNPTTSLKMEQMGDPDAAQI